MSISHIIYWCSILIWILPAVRQYGSKYFRFFLVLGISDPLAKTMFIFFGIDPLRMFVVLAIILLISLFNFRSSRNNLIAAFISIILVSLTAFTLSATTANILLVIFHVLIISTIITHFVITIGKEEYINFFYIALVLYETSIIIKLFFYLTKSDFFITNFYLTTGFEILLAIFFITFRSDDKRIHFHVSKDKISPNPQPK